MMLLVVLPTVPSPLLPVLTHCPPRCAGSLTETYSCPEPGVLHVHSVTRVRGEEQECVQVRGTDISHN